MMQPSVPLGSTPPPAGWYPDPFDIAGWRWWNGQQWTGFSHRPGRKPFLPRFLSWPVVVAAPFVVLFLVFAAVEGPIYLLAPIVPALIISPVLWWLDRLEPEPMSSRVHAVLWGATVAILVAGIVNSLVGVVSEVAAVVFSAPLIEEAMKGLGVIWAVRRRELNSMSDGVIYAGFVAMGFALVEDVQYFATAGSEGSFVAIFILRGLLTPFAHPLFTVWLGIAAGREVSQGRGINPRILLGYAVSVSAHMTWNGSLALAGVLGFGEDELGLPVIIVAAGVFGVLFCATAAGLIRMRQLERRKYDQIAPYLLGRYELSPLEQTWFFNYRSMMWTRRQLPRRARSSFDAFRAAFARLVSLTERGGDPELEQVYLSQLVTERGRLHNKLSRQ